MRKIIVVIALVIGGCTTMPVDKPCGVIEDSLEDVRGATAKDQARINTHFEAGVGAGCWGR